MEPAELMQALMDLATRAELEVRVVGRAEAGESPPALNASPRTSSRSRLSAIAR